MRYADAPTVESVIHIAAPPERVWELVTDIHLLATFSTELQRVEWLDGADRPEVGRTFRGYNAHPARGEWSTVSHVVECVPPSVFAWAVQDPVTPVALWRFVLIATEGGTDLTQHARLGPARSGLSEVIERMPDSEERIVAARLREFRAGMDVNLNALRGLAEGPIDG